MVTFTVRIAARVKDRSRETRRVTGPCSKLRFKSVVKRLFWDPTFEERQMEEKGPG